MLHTGAVVKLQIFLDLRLPAPLGRIMMLNHLEETLEGPSDLCWKISADEHSGGKEVDFPESAFLQEFVLENGLPLWRFENVILTPHVAGYSPRIAERHLGLLLDNVRRFVASEPLRNVVNKAEWF